MASRLPLCLALAAFSAAPAFAQSPFYIGGAVGRLHVDSDFPQQVSSRHSGDAVPPADIRVEAARRTGGRVFGGLRFSPMFAIEVDYVDLGEIETGYTTFANQTTVLPDNLTGRSFATWEHQTRPRGFGVSAVATFPLAQDFGILVRGGAARLQSEIRGQVTTFIPVVNNISAPGVVQFNPVSVGPTEREITQTRPVLGIGIDYPLSPRVRVRATWDRYFGVGKPVEANSAEARGKHDIDLIGIGLTVGF